MRTVSLSLQLSGLIIVLSVTCQYKTSAETAWEGKYFPRKPDELEPTDVIKMGVKEDCDDGKTNLSIDYNIDNDFERSICLSTEMVKHDYNKTSVITDHIIPPMYSALHYCMNETITYAEKLPTFGPHRLVWPKYGEFNYLPPQRWIHSLEHGAIVMLYHPCAMEPEVQRLRDILKGCLYKYVISTSKRVSKELPLVLLAWGKSFEMSVADDVQVTKFIRDYAHKGPEDINEDGSYDLDLIESANETSKDISLLCPQAPV